MCQRYYCGYTDFSGCKFETVENFQQILELKLRQTLSTQISEENPGCSGLRLGLSLLRTAQTVAMWNLVIEMVPF